MGVRVYNHFIRAIITLLLPARLLPGATDGSRRFLWPQFAYSTFLSRHMNLFQPV